MYLGTTPQLVIMDAEMIKSVMIKDFDCFVDREKFNILHEVFQNNLFMAEGNRWKRMRSISSPSFTSGKLRGMTPLMDKCIDKFVDYFDNVIKKNNGVINVRKVTAGFTIDVIASTSFATETNANDDRSEDNPFVKNGKELFEFSILRLMSIFLLPTFLLKFLDLRNPLNPRAFEFFVNLSKEIVRQRKTQKSKRNDLVQLMMDAYVDEKELNNTDYQHLSSSMNGI